MAQYVCTGGCGGVSDTPGTCQDPNCPRHGKKLFRVGGDADVLGLGFALAATVAVSLFVLGLSSMVFDWGTEWVELTATVYKGYEATIVGSIIGALYGAVDGFIGGVLVAWFYNKFKK